MVASFLWNIYGIPKWNQLIQGYVQSEKSSQIFRCTKRWITAFIWIFPSLIISQEAYRGVWNLLWNVICNQQGFNILCLYLHVLHVISFLCMWISVGKYNTKSQSKWSDTTLYCGAGWSAKRAAWIWIFWGKMKILNLMMNGMILSFGVGIP